MSNLEVFFPDARLTELGKIKIGGKGREMMSKSGTKWRAPEKHDYFTITTMHRTAAGDLTEDAALTEQLAKSHGDSDGRLRQLPIRVLSNDIDDIMQSAYLWYGGKTLGARSDGKTVTWFNDRKTGARLAEPLEEAWQPEYLDLQDTRNNRLFKLHTVFNCVIAAPEAKWGGVYKFRTTSIISSKQLYQSLVHLHQLTGGILVAMPLMLVVRPAHVSPQGKATTVYVVHVELRGPELQAIQRQALEVARFQLENRQQVAAVNNEYKRLLLPPGHETGSEAADVVAEFVPESQLVEAAAPPKNEFWEKVIQEGTKPSESAATQATPATDPMPALIRLSAEKLAEYQDVTGSSDVLEPGEIVQAIMHDKVNGPFAPDGKDALDNEGDTAKVAAILKRGNVCWETGEVIPDDVGQEVQP